MDDLKTHLNQESESNWIHGGNSAINDSKDAEKHHPLIISKSSKENIDPEDGQPAGGKKKEKNQKEKYRLGGKKPLQTLLDEHLDFSYFLRHHKKYQDFLAKTKVTKPVN